MAAPLTKDANGTTVTATVGTPVNIKLVGNPTTGYAWSGKNVDESAYELKVDYQAPGGQMMGAPGMYHITVTPKKAGEHPVKLVYSRSFEPGNPPAETFSVTLSVA